MTDTTPDFLCSTLSLESGEQLFGSASTNEVWFLLEYSRPWGAKVLPESDLSESIKTALNSYLSTIPKSNLLFIKQQFRHIEGIAFYVALTRETDPQLYEFHLESYDDLLTLDIPAIVSGDPAYDDRITSEPLYLICTNARRDQCCARYGLPAYKTMVNQTGSRVWQCSHLGGHRFAPTALFLPHGINYGRFNANEIGQIMSDYDQGIIQLAYLRGRVCYDSPAQAADYFLRAEIESGEIDALKLVDQQQMEKDTWLVRFESPAEKITYNVHVQKLMTETETFTSCNAAEKVPMWKYHLLALSRIPNPA
jgi:hypothetical protein